jgi:hypothetical protein
MLLGCQVEEDKMGRACNTHGDVRNVYKILVRKPEGKKPLGRTRCGREDNARMGLREVVWEGVDWTHLAQDRDQ